MQKKVLIFGKGGQLGYDLTQVFGKGYDVIAFDRSEADITNNDEVDKIISQQKPWLVINATAYNKVEAAETAKEEAFNVNAKGAENLAKACQSIGAIFVHVSTDYVFDGTKDFFTETDEPNALSVYGQSKLEGERLAQESSEKLYLVRTSAVFGVKEGNQKMNFVDKMVSIAKEGKTLKVVNDQITSPTYSLDLANKIKDLVEKPAPFGTYHITNQGSCSWYEFTLEILRLMNINTEVVPISTSESGTKVTRPKKSILKNEALEKAGFVPMPTWQSALGRYLKGKYN